MDKRRLCRYAAAFVTVAVLALSGCTTTGGDPGTTSTSGTTTTPGSTSTTSRSSSTTPATTTPTQPSGDPHIPVAAQANTAAGAEAFTKYFLTQTNATYQQLRPELIEPLVNSSCKTCAGFVSQVKEYISKGQRYEGEFVTPTLVTVSNFNGASANVFVLSDTAAARVIGSDGKTVQELPAEKGNTTTFLSYASGSWKVDEIKVVA